MSHTFHLRSAYLPCDIASKARFQAERAGVTVYVYPDETRADGWRFATVRERRALEFRFVPVRKAEWQNGSPTMRRVARQAARQQGAA